MSKVKDILEACMKKDNITVKHTIDKVLKEKVQNIIRNRKNDIAAKFMNRD